MGIRFNTLRDQLEEETPMWKSDRRLFLNADRSAVVEDGSPEARFLLVGEGDELTEDEAKRYGLVKAEKAQAKPADKAVAKPADKAVRKPADK